MRRVISYGRERFLRHRKILLVVCALAVVAITVLAIVFANAKQPGDETNPGVSFTAPKTTTTTPSKPAKSENFNWPFYGYNAARTRAVDVPRSLKPPFKLRWRFNGNVLIEFSPVLAGKRLFSLRNDALSLALSKTSGKILWKRDLGKLAAASPAYSDGHVFNVLLSRAAGVDAGRVVAQSASSGRILWAQNINSRIESSPVVVDGTVYFGSESGTLYALSAASGRVQWTAKASGAIKGGVAVVDNRLFFGTYGGNVYALRRSDGKQIWRNQASGSTLGVGGGNFYSTPAAAYGRIYLGNTDGRVYSLSQRDGKLAWARQTGDYVYSSPAVASPPGSGPSVYIGSYDGTFYSFDARTGRTRWSYHAGGRISGAPTVLGSTVYFANLDARDTIGLRARNGKRVFTFNRGGYNPVITDREKLYITGYLGLYALAPTD